MFRAVLLTGAVVSTAILSTPASAGPICVISEASGLANYNTGSVGCVPYNNGVICKTTTTGAAPTQVVSVTVCVPNPIV